MKSVELRRHAEKDPNGILTENGIRMSRKLGESLPRFSKVISSDSARAQLTAKLITGSEPEVDLRASMWMTSPEKSIAINELANQQRVMFFEAMQKHNDPATLKGTDLRANELNELIDQLFIDLKPDERGLIVSHDLSINAAMFKRGVPLEAIAPLEGYVIYENGDIKSATLNR